MATYSMVLGNKTNEMDMEPLRGLLATSIKVTGKKTKGTDTVP